MWRPTEVSSDNKKELVWQSKNYNLLNKCDLSGDSPRNMVWDLVEYVSWLNKPRWVFLNSGGLSEDVNRDET